MTLSLLGRLDLQKLSVENGSQPPGVGLRPSRAVHMRTAVESKVFLLVACQSFWRHPFSNLLLRAYPRRYKKPYKKSHAAPHGGSSTLGALKIQIRSPQSSKTTPRSIPCLDPFDVDSRVSPELPGVAREGRWLGGPSHGPGSSCAGRGWRMPSCWTMWGDETFGSYQGTLSRIPFGVGLKGAPCGCHYVQEPTFN